MGTLLFYLTKSNKYISVQREAFITLMRQNKPLIFVSFSTCAFWHFEHNKAVSLLLQYTESEGKHLYRYLPNWMTLSQVDKYPCSPGEYWVELSLLNKHSVQAMVLIALIVLPVTEENPKPAICAQLRMNMTVTCKIL